MRKYDLSRLRFLASVGEPLNPEAVVWSNRVYGRPFHDNWWQTETGGIMIANFAGDGHQARIDGARAARHRCGDRRRAEPDGTVAPCRGADDGGRARPAARLAVDVPRLSGRTRALPRIALPMAGT